MSAPTSGPKIACAAWLSGLTAVFALCTALAEPPPADPLAEGRRLYLAADKGNCKSCHRAGEETNGATVGPQLIDIRSKYPEHTALLTAVGEMDSLKPDTIMPPYRRHRILTWSEIELIACYLETL